MYLIFLRGQYLSQRALCRAEVVVVPQVRGVAVHIIQAEPETLKINLVTSNFSTYDIFAQQIGQ